MKVLFSLLMILVISCNNNPKSACKQKDKVVNDTVFNDSDILAGFKFNCSGKINELNLITKLDQRSRLGNMQRLKNISLKYGVFGDTILSKILSTKNGTIDFNKRKKLLFLNLKLESPLADSINYISLQTISSHIENKRKYTMNSEPYFYKNSIRLLGMENTYVDYRSFRDKNVVTKIKFKKNSALVDDILITVKTSNQDMDSINQIGITINDSLTLDFESSILAAYHDTKLIDENAQLISMIKRKKKFLELKIDVHKIGLQRVKNLKVQLNGKIYQ